MKYRRQLSLLILFFSALVPIFAQSALYKPFTSFRVIKTERFDIIFPKESEATARLLATFADRSYEYASSLLGIEVPGRIPVTITPHTDMFNGYYSLAFNHIVLFDTPMDVEWTTYANNLEGLFLHELTHAISLNSSAPGFRIFRRIFGNWFSPTFITVPDFMVEGVTVSFESLGGAGRANDPRTKQYLRQAVHEDKFLTPFQASGVYDRPNLPSGYWYEYGGLFSAWLQQTFGMERYAELWQKMGSEYYMSFFVYRSDFYKIFQRVYNMDFLDAWNIFKAAYTITDLETNDDEILPREYRYLSEKNRFFQALTANGNNIYFHDQSKRKISIYNTETKKIRSFNTDSLTYDIDVSADGTKILLSGYNYLQDRYFAIVSEHRAGSGLRTGRSINGLYNARYFRDGVIGLRSQLHNNCIVYEDFKGNSEVLFSGNESLMFSGPQVLDEDRIAFVAARNGKRELWLYNYSSRELYRIESSDGNEYWHYMRGLSASNGKLFFSHNANNRMYKLGIVNLETMRAVFNERDFSGGVFNPVLIDDSVYYLGAFVSQNKLLRFPEGVSSVSGEHIALQLVKINNLGYEEILDSPPSAPVYKEPAKVYFAFKYMNPFNYWMPVPLIRVNETLRLDGGGILTIMNDPTDRNLISVLIYGDAYYKMASVDTFNWQNTSLGFPLSIDFSDTVVESGISIYRYTSASFSGAVNWGLGNSNNEFLLGAGYARAAGFENEKSAYEWEQTGSAFFIQAGYSFSYDRLDFQVNGASVTDSFSPRIDAVFKADTNTRFPMHFTLFGAYDDSGMDLHGISNTFGNMQVTDYSLNEYGRPSGLELNWIAGGEAAITFISIQIQNHLSHLYFNRLSGALVLRNQLYDSMGHPEAEGVEINNLRLIQSLGLRFGVKMSFLPIIKTAVSIEPYSLLTWKFSNAITGAKSHWSYYIGFNTSF
jgi:hypothetical protein